MRKLFLLSKTNLAAILGLLVYAAGMQGQAVPADAGEPPAHGSISSKDLVPRITEDWTTPSLVGSQLMAGETIVIDDMGKSSSIYTRQLARVEWRPGDPIDLYIVKPAGVEKPPVILYLYSYPSDLDKFRNDDFCKFLVKDGFAAVAFSSALNGHRYHAPRPMKQWFASEMRESLATSAHDVQMVLNFLGDRKEVDMDRIGMFGDGSGATIAILVAAVDPRIKTLDLLNPWGDWPDWAAKSTLIPEMERPAFMKQAWLDAAAPLDPTIWLPKLKTEKIRLQLISTVTVTPTESKKKIEAVAPPNAEIVHYPDANAFKVMAQRGVGFDWVKEHVQPGSVKPLPPAGELQSQNPAEPSKPPAQ